MSLRGERASAVHAVSGFGALLVLFAAVIVPLAAPTTVNQSDPVNEPATTPPDSSLRHSLDEVKAAAFTENRGQLDDSDVRFYAASGRFQVGFTHNAVLLAMSDPAPAAVPGGERDETRGVLPSSQPAATRGMMLRLRFDGASEAIPQGREPRAYLTHFFLGGDPGRWRTGVRSFGEVVYEELYPGIDLAYRTTPAGVKYEFRLRPGADPGTITLAYEGADGVAFDGAGNAHILTSLGDLTDSAPVAYQGADRVSCSFDPRSADSYGFDCRGVDASRSLVIDPLLNATFLGGTAWDSGGGSPEDGPSMALDSARNAYVAGYSDSPDFPATRGAYNETLSGNQDVFIAKLDPSLSTLISATYLGGSGRDSAYSIALDSAGNAYVTGGTSCCGFPVIVGDMTLNGSYDAFVAKLDPTLSTLVYATYLGGNETSLEYGDAIAVDPLGFAHVAGITDALNFPVTQGAFDETFNTGATDVFVAKLDPTGSGLVYATYLDGDLNPNDATLGTSIALDAGGNAYVTGGTAAPGFFTPGAFDVTLNGTWDAFVAKVDPNGSALLYATYLGGELGNGDVDWGMSIAVDSGGNAYVTGQTDSPDFPNTTNAYDRTFNGGQGDAFVVKLNASGDTALYATYLGGSLWDIGNAIAVDARGNAYLVGRTNSDNFPTSNDAFDRISNNKDGFVARLILGNGTLDYATYLGGDILDAGHSIALDSAGNVYVAGQTTSLDFPATVGAYQENYNGVGLGDAFVAKFVWPSVELMISAADVAFTPPFAVNEGGNLTIEATVHNVGDKPASTVRVRFHLGPPLGGSQIGTDQFIPSIADVGGTGVVSMVWQAGPAGPQELCVVVDPDDAVGELNESDNEACATIQVLSPPMVDLAVSPSDFTLSPASPYGEGDPVWVNATVRNIGPDASGATLARFYDGSPPSPQIGADQTVPALPANGTAVVSVLWTASVAGSHALYLEVDPGGLVTESDESNNVAYVSVFVDAPPTAVASAVPSVADLDTVITFNGTASTDDVAITAYHWDFGDGGSADTANATHQYALRDTFLVNLTVWDALGRNDVASLTVDVINRPPTADAGLDSTLAKNTVAVLTGLASDPDGDPLGYSWTQTAGPAVVLSDPSVMNPSFTPPRSGTYAFRLHVDDGYGGNATDSVTVTATNAPPLADAGADQAALENASVTLDSTGSSDPDVDDLTFAWTQATGPAVTLIGADTATPSFLPAQPGVYTFSLEVSDGDGGFAVDTVTVTVPAVPPPLSLVANADVTVGPAPLAVNFTAAGSGGNGIYLWQWDFRDGTAAAVEDPPRHTFPAPGIYDVTVWLNDTGGNATSRILRITAATTPVVLDRCTVTPDGGTVGLGSTQTFTAHGWSGTVEVPGTQIDVLWTASGNAGTITAGGLFTSNDPGTGSVTATVSHGLERTTCTVAVTVAPPESGFPWWLLILATAAGVLLGLLRVEPVRVTLWTLFMALWARLRRRDILEQEKRGMVLGYLAANPAVHFAAIRSDLEMATGTLTYHLWVLEKEGAIKSWRDGRFRRYAPGGHRVAEMQPSLTAIELLLLKKIREKSGLTQRELAKDVGVSQPAVSYHISRMAHLGVIHVERHGRSKRYTATLDQATEGALAPGDGEGLQDPGSPGSFGERGTPP